jgi:hypothetical protein
MHHEMMRRRAGALKNSEFAKVPGLQRTIRCAHIAQRPGQAFQLCFGRAARFGFAAGFFGGGAAIESNPT